MRVRWARYGNLPVLELSSWRECGNVRAVFTCRLGGVSQGAYWALNLGHGVGDAPEAVHRNRRLFWESVGVLPGSIVSSSQVHGDKVLAVSKRAGGNWGPADGLVTAETGTYLVGYYADCTPVFLFDPKKRAVGLVHAGWRGTVLRISSSAVEVMGKEFGSKPGDLKAVIGPSIGVCCYEVGEEVVVKFKEVYEKEAQAVKRDGSRFYLDLKRANFYDLASAGVLAGNIYVSDLCTSCLKELFYSYRRDKGVTGRMAALIGLDEPRH